MAASLIGLLTTYLGTPIEDVDEESFLLFSQPIPSRSLGFVDSKATTLNITIGEIDLEINQSPTLLGSDRSGGTTGAVLWSITPLLATYLSHPSNILIQTKTLHASSTVLELGAGISGIMPLILSPQVSQYIATDQPYVLKHLRENLLQNAHAFPSSNSNSSKKTKPTPAKSNKAKNTTNKKLHAKPPSAANHDPGTGNITILPLDWETSNLATLPSIISSSSSLSSTSSPASPDPAQPPGIDVLLALDCIYNPALLRPLTRTCAEICSLRPGVPCVDDSTDTSTEDEGPTPTLVLVAQQLRAPDVFEAWLRGFGEVFHVWRMGDDALGEFAGEGERGLGGGSGFVVHVGVWKGGIV